MTFEMELDDFQGPLDLLLHLIKEKEMDLENLEISIICDQYLAYIESQDPTLLESMSEYLVMASTLIEMKSKLILPNEKVELEDDYVEDPREALIRRLLEYKRYKDILEDIRESYEHRQTMHTKSPAAVLSEVTEDNGLPEGLEIYDLMRAMQKMYQRKALSIPLESKVARVEISIEERSDSIRSFFKLHKGKRVNLEELFDHPSATYFVVTFLAVLTLVNQKELIIEQSGNFDEIYIKEYDA